MSDTYIPIDWLPSSARLGGREIICDGINANRCNTGLGSALRLWGVRPPTAAQLAAMTTVAGSGGSMTAGEHIVAVTFAVTTPGGVILAESGPIQSAAVPVTANGKITIGNLPLSDNAAVNARVVYMTLAGGTELYRVTAQATVADNVTTSYEITVSDGSLTVLTVATQNEFLPACAVARALPTQIALGGTKPWTEGTASVTNGDDTVVFTNADLTRAVEGKTFLVTGAVLGYVIESFDEATQTATLNGDYQGSTDTDATYRIMGSPNTVYFTNALPDNIEGYDPLSVFNSVDVGGDDGDEITALGVCRGNVVVGKHRSTYLLVRDSTGWTPVCVSTEVGCAGHATMVQDGNGNALWYGGAGGVYLMHGGEFQTATNRPQLISQDIEPLLRDGVNHGRDHMAHAQWYEPRKWYVLWLTRIGETAVTDLMLIADFSQPTRERPCQWWICRLPAASSRSEKFSDDETRLLIGTYHGGVWVCDTGSLDGVQGMSCIGTVSGVNGNDITCDDAWFDDVAGSSSAAGAVLTVLSGTGAGQRRLISAAAGQTVTVDTAYYGGALSPNVSVGDKIMLGGYSSYWQTPRLSVKTVGQKRWCEASIAATGQGANLWLRPYTWARGRQLTLNATLLPVNATDLCVAAQYGIGENWQGEFGTDGPAQPWQLNGVTLIAQPTGAPR